MYEWHDEFRAYARAFDSDEVAAILLRDGDSESLVWPDQKVEGLTFTLTADAILSAVPENKLQYVVGWVHSHPSGIKPSPSSVDDKQIRQLSRDVSSIAEMWIFGGHGYNLYSVTRAVVVSDVVFVSDTETWQIPQAATQWDDGAARLYEASKPVYKIGKFDSYIRDYDEKIYTYICPACQSYSSDKSGEMCYECDDSMEVGAPGTGWDDYGDIV